LVFFLPCDFPFFLPGQSLNETPRHNREKRKERKEEERKEGKKRKLPKIKPVKSFSATAKREKKKPEGAEERSFAIGQNYPDRYNQFNLKDYNQV